MFDHVSHSQPTTWPQDFLLSYDRESIKPPGKEDAEAAGNAMSFELLGRWKELFLSLSKPLTVGR